jgi:predicted unusual protein kinase regulating ubiquinone biosynthesis (AarF/ABC1/UbiB family)
MTAAASIAQGHLAMLKDRQAVAVKVGAVSVLVSQLIIMVWVL